MPRQTTDLNGKYVILADDGIATGSTMLIAIALLKHQNPKKIIAAVPVAPTDAVNALGQDSDEVVTLLTPDEFHSVGEFYEEFEQLTDADVKQYLAG